MYYLSLSATWMHLFLYIKVLAYFLITFFALLEYAHLLKTAYGSVYV